MKPGGALFRRRSNRLDVVRERSSGKLVVNVIA
jgi:hypothetical protein